MSAVNAPAPPPAAKDREPATRSSKAAVSVVVPTRNRPSDVLPCVLEILKSEWLQELIVVDQSDDDRTEKALAPQLGDARLRYLRSEPLGVCAARNVGIKASRGDILVCTDDDCRASPTWLERYVERFEHHPEAAVLCGKVVVSDELSKSGYAVSYAAEVGELTVESMRRGSFPLTANLAFRRATIERAGMFDEALGAGGPLRSGGEPDFLLRVLRRGLRIFDAPEAEVAHLGVRTGRDGPALVRKYLFGTGAAMAKHVRLGDPWGWLLLGAYLKHFSRQAAKNLLRTGRPRGAEEAVALAVGALSSLRFRVDAKTRLFKKRG